MRLLVILLLFCQVSTAQTVDPLTGQKTAVVEATTGLVRNGIYEWGGGLNYSIRTDLADQVKPRAYLHALDFAYGFDYTPWDMSFGAGVSAAYESIGERRSEILLDENRKELFVNDIGLYGEKRFAGPWSSKFEVGLANEFPTSPEAQREDYASVTSFNLGWSVPAIPKRLYLTLTSEVYYIWNNYEFSPATHELNKQGGWKIEARARLIIWKGLFFNGVLGTQMARYLDDSGDSTYRNSLGVGYAWKKIAASLSTSNGTYLDREDAGVWFVDEYRRTVAFSVRYSF